MSPLCHPGSCAEFVSVSFQGLNALSGKIRNKFKMIQLWSDKAHSLTFP